MAWTPAAQTKAAWRVVALFVLCQIWMVVTATQVRVLLEQAGSSIAVTVAGAHQGYLHQAGQVTAGNHFPASTVSTPQPTNQTMTAQNMAAQDMTARRPQPVDAYLASTYTTSYDAPVFATAFTLEWQLRAQAGNLYSEGALLGPSFTLRSETGIVDWRGQRYRGGLRFIAEGDTILVINVVGLEDYLRGVVPEEMFASWPLEALKAQAIAARTYTLSSLDESLPYDICATYECQSYGGINAEHSRSNDAIQATQDIVLAHAGNLARTYYHADSGGFTASSVEVWGEDYAYLQAQNDSGANLTTSATTPLETTSPHRRWQHTVNVNTVAASLQQYNYNVGTINALNVINRSASGRVETFEVVGSEQTVQLSGPLAHRLLREWGFKSTKLEMISPLTAVGDGWGHGVGMSQYGALTLANNNYGYAQILDFYYPSTYLHQLTGQQ
ncbi:MAG: SpoIID/LytB domain-containing protein [Deinococcota bacterium]